MSIRTFLGFGRARVLRLIGVAAAMTVGLVLAIALFNFPFDVDAPLSAKELEDSRKFYAEAYKRPANVTESGPTEFEMQYLQTAKDAAEGNHIEEQVQEFVTRFKLNRRPVLEIGSGRGYLQDVAEDYTGLDISSNVQSFYHKKFVLGSATAMPFPDDSFDGAWSIWVLEHVPNPEQALREMRRVVRDSGVIFLMPAWNCNSWAAEGYEVRPFSDFDLTGKIVKASVPIRSSTPYWAAHIFPNRLIRWSTTLLGGPTTLHYLRLTPNYHKYWVPDSDAVNSIDRFETMLWFRSRGDECLNCSGVPRTLLKRYGPLIIRIHK